MTVGGMGFIPERLLMMMMMMIDIIKNTVVIKGHSLLSVEGLSAECGLGCPCLAWPYPSTCSGGGLQALGALGWSLHVITLRTPTRHLRSGPGGIIVDLLSCHVIIDLLSCYD